MELIKSKDLCFGIVSPESSKSSSKLAISMSARLEVPLENNLTIVLILNIYMDPIQS